METAHELLMGLSDSEFDNLRQVRDTKGYEAAVELLTPKFSGKACSIVNELDRIDNFAKPKKNEAEEGTKDLEETEAQPLYINIAPEGEEAQYVPNPKLAPTTLAGQTINEKILQDPVLKANDIQDGMPAGQAEGAQIAMNRINDMKIQQFSAPLKLSYSEALDLIRETYLKDLKKEVFDDILSAYKSKPLGSDGGAEVTPILKKNELSLEGVDGILDILSKIKEDTDNFGTSGRKVVYFKKENFDMKGRKVILANFDRDAAGTIVGAGTGAVGGTLVGAGAGGYLGYKGLGKAGEKLGNVIAKPLNTIGEGLEKAGQKANKYYQGKSVAANNKATLNAKLNSKKGTSLANELEMKIAKSNGNTKVVSQAQKEFGKGIKNIKVNNVTSKAANNLKTLGKIEGGIGKVAGKGTSAAGKLFKGAAKWTGKLGGGAAGVALGAGAGLLGGTLLGGTLGGKN